MRSGQYLQPECTFKLVEHFKHIATLTFHSFITIDIHGLTIIDIKSNNVFPLNGESKLIKRFYLKE